MTPEEKKLAEVQRTGKAFVAALYAYLPLLDLTDSKQEDLAHGVLSTIAYAMGRIAKLEKALHTTTPLPAEKPATEQEAEELSINEETAMRILIQRHDIYVGQEPGEEYYVITHPSIQGRAHALNKREVYEIVTDIAEKIGGPTA